MRRFLCLALVSIGFSVHAGQFKPAVLNGDGLSAAQDLQSLIIPFSIPTACTGLGEPNPAAVEGWYFRAISGYPAAITFECVVLFKNGDYVEVGDEPVDGMDAAASKKKYPKAWGTWKKTGNTFYLTNSKGQVSDYELGNGNWFPAYAYTGSPRLKPKYSRTGGGDYGNGTASLMVEKIHFTDATHFTTGVNSGITTPNASAGKKSNNAGTYVISNHTITLTFADGSVQKRSFAMGASGSPAKPSNSIIFIGGSPYTDED